MLKAYLALCLGTGRPVAALEHHREQGAKASKHSTPRDRLGKG